MQTFDEIIEELETMVTQDRMKTHGDPYEQFGLTSRLWSEYLGVAITRTDVALLMALSKISRFKHGRINFDDLRDNLGYGLIAQYCGNREYKEGVSVGSAKSEICDTI